MRRAPQDRERAAIRAAIAKMLPFVFECSEPERLPDRLAILLRRFESAARDDAQGNGGGAKNPTSDIQRN
jgi:hypothetical protein